MFNFDHAFFAVAWRRHLTVAVCFAWAVVELATGAMIWAVLFFAGGALALWRFGQIDWSKYDAGSD